jgi:L-glutamine---4-(methylsulfanyl)-2-oxobutanoate aminotransferase
LTDRSTRPAAPELLGRLPEQFFTGILKAAAEARAQPGERFIDLGRGNPDLPPPPAAIEAVREAMLHVADPSVHGYPPFQGMPALREAIAARYRADYGVELDPEVEVAVIPGTKTGIMLVCLACAGPGDDILLPDPGYPDYHSGVALAGARAAALPLEESAGWQPSFDGVHGALVALNYPSNPCAILAADGVMEEAVAWAHAKGAWIVHDIAYGFLGFERRVRSVLEVPGAREVATELWSPSKIYGMAGWRVGFLVGNAEIVGRVKTLLDHLFAGVPAAIQRGLLAALTGDQGHVSERRERYRARRDVLVSALPGLARPEGSFYAWWKLPEGLTPEEIIRRARVGVAPGPGFGSRGAGYARLSLAVPDEDVAEGAARLAALLG